MITVHEIQSPHQAGPTQIRVLSPDSPAGIKSVLYVLPVQAGLGVKYGDGLAEVERLGLADKHRLLAIAPTFFHLPWYADHPRDPKIRQESCLLESVLPFVEKRYPAAAGLERNLIGFSKSGFGSVSLLCRHPDLFSKAAVFDTPFAMLRFDAFGATSGEIFGTQENFEGYQLLNLLEKNAETLKTGTRLGIFGGANFVYDHQVVRPVLQRLRIPHFFDESWDRKHTWESGWMGEAVEFLSLKP